MVGNNLVPQVFVPYCTGLMKQATLESSVEGSIFICFNNQTGWKKNTKKVIYLKARHVQFNRKSNIFGL